MDFSENRKKERELPDDDHRLLGQQLDLFSISEDVGIGLVLWHPKGTAVRNTIRDLWEEEHMKNGYQLVCTPHIARKELWKTSGHIGYYEQNMYVFEKDDEHYVVKPMNCPLHIQIYKAKPRSYRELPVRYAEWGTVYRHERSGTMHGLLRVRGFTQDDAHIFCAPEQAESEVLQLLDFSTHVLRAFGFSKYRAVLSTRDPKRPKEYMGSKRLWRLAEKALAATLEKKKIEYAEMTGEAVFYGPKIDMYIVGAAGRDWQCSTIQFDFNLPKRFNACYVGQDGKEHEVVMIHRALLGSIERFFAILTERYAGNFPFWLAPIQARILPINDKLTHYAQCVHDELRANGIRSEIDADPSTISSKIRRSEVQKIPYMLICGKREEKNHEVSIRKHGVGNTGSMSIKEFIRNVKREQQRGASQVEDPDPKDE